MTPYNTDLGPEFKLKIHCQLNETHLEFIMNNCCVAFEDDQLCPDTPDEFVALISATQNEITSEADYEMHVATVTPVQDQLRNLLKTLENDKN
uniref:Uncharacterized protein n=1 Tax=Panagrolaimus superbus TaxID=310955 RepID=A0A914YM73_9BILA